MATYIGDAGGIAVGVETVFGTETAAWVFQNTAPSSFGHRADEIDTGMLAGAYKTGKEFIFSSDGDIVTGYTRKRARNVFLGTLGALATQTYTFGNGTTPDNVIGLSALVDYGGWQVKHTGCSVQKLRWDLAQNTTVKQTATLIGRGGAVDLTPETVTIPTIADMVLDSDLTTFTLGGSTILILGATIEVDPMRTGKDRRGLGASGHRQPVSQGPWKITASLQCELCGDTGNNTVAELAHLLAGSTADDLVIDDWTLKNCYIMGDMPALQQGIITFPINVTADYLTLLTET